MAQQMPLSPDEYQGQLVDPGYPSEFDTQDPESSRQYQVPDDNNVQQMVSPEQESCQSRVEETQFIDLEIDPQANTPAMRQASFQATHQDGYASRVDDTQTPILELDTHANTQSADISRRIRGAANQTELFDEFVNYESYAEHQSTKVAVTDAPSHPFAESSTSAPRFERPVTHDTEDPANNFKFASAKNPVRTPVNIAPSHSQPAMLLKHPEPHTNEPATSGHRDAALITEIQDTDPSSCQAVPSMIVAPEDQEYFRAPKDAPCTELPPSATRNDPRAFPYTGHGDHNTTKLEPSARYANSSMKPRTYSLDTAPPLISSSLPHRHDTNPIGRTSPSSTGADNAMRGLTEQSHHHDVRVVRPSPTIIRNTGSDSRHDSEWPIPEEIVQQHTILREALAPLRGKENARPPRVLSKGRRFSVNNARVPFPEAATPQSKRRQPLQDSSNTHQEHPNTSESQVSIGQNAVPSNSGRAREPGRDESQGSGLQARPNASYKPSISHSRKFQPPDGVGAKALAHKNLYEHPEQKNASPDLAARYISSHTEALAFGSASHHQQLPMDQQIPRDNGDIAHTHTSSPTSICQYHSDHSVYTLANADACAANEEPVANSQCEPKDLPDHVDTDRFREHPDLISVVEDQEEQEAYTSGFQPLVHSNARPGSRRSNQGKIRGGPVLFGEPAPQAFYKLFDSHNDASKIMKSSIRHMAVNKAARSQSPAPQTGPTLAGYQMFLKTGEQYAKAIDGFEQQKILIESQQLDILKLQHVNDSRRQQVEALEAEKATLTQSIQKYADMSSKYKRHMNDVVKSQKYLKAQAAEIKRSASAAQLAVMTKNEAILLEIKTAIQEAKDQGLTVETLSKKLSIAHDQKRKLGEENATMESEKNSLQALVDTEKSTNDTLRVELERLRLDLSREIRSRNQLENSLDSQTTVCKELVEQLNQLPGALSDRLQQEDGALASILSAENATHVKIDRVTSLIDALKSVELEPPAALVKLIEHLFSRFENREEISEAGHSSFLEANSKALEGLKENLGQLRLDKDTEIRYIERVGNLELCKEALISDKTAREQEIQILTQQLDELRRSQEDFRSQLISRTEELAATRANSREDPRLVVKIGELESATTALERQLKSANLEASRARDEASSIERSAHLKEQQVKDLERRLDDAQRKIKSFDEEQSRYIAAKEHEIKVVCQDLTNKAETQKATMKLKLESEVKNIGQKYKEKDVELSLAKQEIQRLQSGRDASDNASANMQQDDSQFLEKASKLVAQIKRMKEQNRKFSYELARSVCSVKNESSEIHQMLQRAMNEPSQLIEAAVRKQRDIEAKIRQASVAGMEIELLKEQKVVLQTKVKSLSEIVARHSQPAHMGLHKARSSANMSPVNLSPAQGTSQRTGSEFPLRPEDNRQKWESQEISEHSASSGVGTPEETLRQQLKMVDSRSTFKPGGTAQSSATTNASVATPQIHGGRHQNLVAYASATHASARVQRLTPKNSTEYIKPFSEMTPSSQTSASSLTDLDSLMDRILAEDDHGLVSNNGTSVNRISGEQQQEKIVKHTLGTRTPNEASMKPLKSAMKKPAAKAKNVPSSNTLNHAQADLKNVGFIQKNIRQERRPENFVGAVSGGRIGSVSVASSSLLLQTSEHKLSDQILPIQVNDFRQKKRSSYTDSDATEPEQKRRLASRRPSRSIIPDSQET